MVHTLRRVGVAALIAGSLGGAGLIAAQEASAMTRKPVGCTVLNERFQEEQDAYWAAVDADDWDTAAVHDANASRLMRDMEALHC
jgi:hypothetical protein